MSVTLLRGGLNTYPTSVPGGSIPDANRIIDVSKWAKALEPRETPYLTKIWNDAPVNARPFLWGQSKRVPVQTTLGIAHDNSTTTLTVASGSGVILQKWMVLELSDFKAGSTTTLDPARREIVIVVGEPSGDTALVARAQSGTAGIAHDAGCQVFVIGTAEPELQFHTISPHARGWQLFNYVQRWEGGVKADIAARNTPTWEHPSDPFLADFEEETKKQKFLMELAFWRGGRQAGNPTTPLPATMGGIDTYLLTNVTDVGGANLTPRVIESELRDLAKATERGPEGLRLMMSYNTAAIFDSLIDPIRMATATDTTLTLMTEKVRFRFGTFDITVSHNCFDNVIYGVRDSNLAMRPYKGLAWHISRIRGVDAGADHDQQFISCDATLVVEREAEMFRLINFNGDLDGYESPFSP